MVLKEGALIYQYYKSNKIRDNLQRINSCTKSFISIFIGIALEKEYIPSLDLSVEHYFPDTVNNQADLRKKDITINHLITMSVGLDWPEFGELKTISGLRMLKELAMVLMDCSYILSLAKIGQLYLQNGMWEGKQIVSAEWIKRSTEPRLLTYDYIGHYASHWWVAKLDPENSDFSIKNRMFFAIRLSL